MPNSELIERYRARAPRYTSYPTAPRFAPIDKADIDQAIAASTAPISLYVHLPFCQSLCWYCGCSVEIRRDRTIAGPYVQKVLAEARLLRDRFQGERAIAQLSLGGGTPTFLRQDDMRALIQGLDALAPFTPDADRSLEIDPRVVDESYLDTLWELGFRRFSFGVQDFDPEVLEAVHRQQPVALTSGAMKHLHAIGAPVINLDLLYGLPVQDLDRWERTLAQTVELAPTRVALFHYAHVPWMKPAQKLLEKYGRPDSLMKARMFERAEEVFGDAGYVRVGMDHFARPDDPLAIAFRDGTLGRNFQGYATGVEHDMFGLGVTSIGFFNGVYSQNEKDRAAWEARVDAGELPIIRGYRCTDEDLLRRRVIMSLMSLFKVRWADVGTDAAHFATEVESLRGMEADGLLVIREDGVDVTVAGRDFVRNVGTAFDQYYEDDPTQRRYSQTA